MQWHWSIGGSLQGQARPIANTQRHTDLLTSEAGGLQQIQLILEQGAVGERQQRLGHIQREGVEQLGVHVGEDDSLWVFMYVCEYV